MGTARNGWRPTADALKANPALCGLKGHPMNHDTALKIQLYPDFVTGQPCHPLEWSHDELLALEADNIARHRKPMGARPSLADSRDLCDKFYFAHSSSDNVDDLRPEVQHEAPLHLLASLDAHGHWRLALAAHRVAMILNEIATAPGKTSAACQRRWWAQARKPHGKTHAINVGYYADGSHALEVTFHGLTVRIRNGRCTITAPEHTFSLDRIQTVESVSAPFNEAQIPRFRRLFSAWAKLRREWIADHVVVAMPGYRPRPGEVARLMFVLEHAFRGKETSGAFPVGRFVGYPTEFHAMVLDTSDVDRTEAYGLVGDLARLRRYTWAETFAHSVDKAFLAYLPQLIRVLRRPLPTTAESLAAMDAEARPFIKATDADGHDVELDDPSATAFTVYQDDCIRPRPLTTTRWLATAIAIERANRKQVAFRLGLAIGNGTLRYQVSQA